MSHNRRRQIVGNSRTILDEARRLVLLGERVRLSLHWDKSYHAAHYWVTGIVGEGVRYPMTLEQVEGFEAKAEKQAYDLWQLVRG